VITRNGTICFATERREKNSKPRVPAVNDRLASGRPLRRIKAPESFKFS
jgi:hypothetical protein